MEPFESYNAVEVAANPEEYKLLNRDERKEMLILRELLKDMTAFQIRFVEQYIRTASPGMAAKLAGSTSARPEQIGYNLLQEEKIQKAIAIAMKKRIEAVGLDTIEVIQKLREIYDAAMLAGKYDAANKACELLMKQIDLAQANKPKERPKAPNAETPSEVSRVLDILSKLPRGGTASSVGASASVNGLDNNNIEQNQREVKIIS